MYHDVRIVGSGRCPQCYGRMTSYTDGQGRGWVMCLDCGAQIPTESGYREVKDGIGKSQRDCGGDERPS